MNGIAKNAGVHHKEDICDNIRYGFTTMFPFLILLIKAIIYIGIIALAVHVVFNWLDKPFLFLL